MPATAQSLALVSEKEINPTELLRKEIQDEVDKQDLPYTQMFLKYMNKADIKKHSQISLEEIHSVLKILKQDLKKMHHQDKIKKHDMIQLKRLIDAEILKSEHTLGSPIVSLALKINNYLF